MKTILFILSLVPSLLFSQTKRDQSVIVGINYINGIGNVVQLDSVLSRKAREVSTMVSNEADLVDIQYSLNYGSPKQEFVIFTAKIDSGICGSYIPEFLAENDRSFAEIIKYKTIVGVYITETICVISFYKNRGTISLVDLF